jgi:hypothetical protein
MYDVHDACPLSTVANFLYSIDDTVLVLLLLLLPLKIIT